VCRVASRQVRIGCCVTEIVECDDVELLRAPRFVDGAKYVAPDAAVTIDAYLDCHTYLLRKQFAGDLSGRNPSTDMKNLVPEQLFCGRDHIVDRESEVLEEFASRR
jgi:hypothetical protein